VDVPDAGCEAGEAGCDRVNLDLPQVEAGGEPTDLTTRAFHIHHEVVPDQTKAGRLTEGQGVEFQFKYQILDILYYKLQM